MGRSLDLPSGKLIHAENGGLLLHLGCLWVLLIVDEVLGEGITHELLGLVLHVCGNERGKAVRAAIVSPNSKHDHDRSGMRYPGVLEHRVPVQR